MATRSKTASDTSPDAVATSTSGAVLGQPAREYGAYGMVIDVPADPDAPAPSEGERRVRGVGEGPGLAPEEFQR